MKKPKMKNLKENKRESDKIKDLAGKTDKIKVTFYLDKSVVSRLKTLAQSSGSKYQTLLNSMLREALASRSTFEERISRLESEIKSMKEKISKVA